jgi:hypothetical protein
VHASARTDGKYFKLCKILGEFPDTFREYYRMNMKTFDYTLDSMKDDCWVIQILNGVKDDLQGYSNFWIV